MRFEKLTKPNGGEMWVNLDLVAHMIVSGGETRLQLTGLPEFTYASVVETPEQILHLAGSQGAA